MTELKSKGGRPRKYDEKRPLATFRIPAAILVALKSAAEDAGRSMSEELEYRLSMSFMDKDEFVRLAINRVLAGKG